MPARPRKTAEAVTKPDFATLLAGARLPERTVHLCLRADLVAEHEELDGQLSKLVDKPVAKFAGDGRGELKQRIEALEAEMTAATYPFRFRALPKPAWRAFVAAHPPRKDDAGEVDEADALIGVNRETFFDVLVRRCCIDPVLDDQGWRKLLGDSEAEQARLTAAGREHEIEEGKLTDRQLDRLSDAAWGINRRDIDVPFSRAASRLNQTSEPE